MIAFFSSFSVRAEDGTAVDPVKTFNRPNEFVVSQFALPVRPDIMLRDSLAGPSLSITAWMSGQDKIGNNLEAGINTEFQLGKNSRYPLIVTIPTNMAVEEEQYMFGPHFACVSTGINVRVSLSFVPSRYGTWSAGGNVDVYYFGTTLAEVVHSVGLQMPKLAAVLRIEF